MFKEQGETNDNQRQRHNKPLNTINHVVIRESDQLCTNNLNAREVSVVAATQELMKYS